MTVVLVLLIFLVACFLPIRIRKSGFMIASSITAAIILLLVVRPYWVDYKVSKKTEQLGQYLEAKYPNEQWDITRQVGRQYNPYHLNVEFENEKGWIYTYSVQSEIKACQRSWTPPEWKFPDEGKHYEGHCELEK